MLLTTGGYDPALSMARLCDPREFPLLQRLSRRTCGILRTEAEQSRHAAALAHARREGIALLPLVILVCGLSP